MSSRSKRKKNGSVPKRLQTPPAKQTIHHTETHTQEIMIQRSGPLPDPGTLKAYEEAFPGLAQTIVQQFTDQSSYRQEMERKVLETEVWKNKSDAREIFSGQLMAFGVAMTGILVAGWCVSHSNSVWQAWAGASIATTGLAPVIGRFITGRKSGSPSDDEGKSEVEKT